MSKLDRRREYQKEYDKANKEKKKEYYKANKEKRKEYQKEYDKANKEKKKEYKKANKEKIKEYQKEYIEANKEKNKKYQEANKEKLKEYYKANKEKLKERAKIYREANKDKIKEYRKENYKANKEKMKEYFKKRRKTDPLFKMKCYLRSRTSNAFKSKGYSKNTKTQKILGVDWEVCKAHIERKFTKGMNWNNYGEWHIDHIIPLASAKNEKELMKLCHYRNLQPLWSEDNLMKSGKILGQQSFMRL